jgi:hypothetical protein
MTKNSDKYMLFTNNETAKGTHFFDGAEIITTHSSYEEAYERGMGLDGVGFAIVFPKSTVGGHGVRRIETIHLLDNGAGLYSEIKQFGIYYFNPAMKFISV